MSTAEKTSVPKKIIVFTDGSSRGNPGPGGWGAVVASQKFVYEHSGSAINTTNNRMELQAVLSSLGFLFEHSQQHLPVEIFTDSQYFKNGFEKWMYGWQTRGWVTAAKKPVLNQDLWEELLSLKGLFHKITINHVRGHVGIPGNERADELATEAADSQKGTLKKFARSTYTVNLSAVVSAQTTSSVSGPKDVVGKADKPKKKKRTGPAFCYLSIVDGKVSQHRTWDDCKQTVAGKSGAKYRRADSSNERDEIIDSWRT